MLPIRKILFAQDFSPCAEHALPVALELATRFEAELHLLYVEVWSGDETWLGQSLQPGPRDDHIREQLGRMPAGGARAEAFRARGMRPIPAVEYDVAAAPALLHYADHHDIDLVVMGTHGRRGVRRLLLGSVAEEVVRRAPCPVLTVRGACTVAEGPRAVLVPVDFSEHARYAWRYGQELARLLAVPLHLLHVVEVQREPAFYNPGLYAIYGQGRQVEARAEEMLRQCYGVPEGPAVTWHVRTGQAAREIVRFAADAGDTLIVMATHGLTGLAHLLIGSVTEQVVRTAPCPVFTVKPHETPLLTPDAPATQQRDSLLEDLDLREG